MDTDTLFAAGVLAAAVGTFVNLFCKPLLLAVWPELKLETNADKWAVAVNYSTLLVAEVGAFLGLYAMTNFTRVDFVNSVLTGISAATMAIGAYAFQSNTRKVI